LLRSAIDADRRYARLRAASMAEGRFEGLVGRAEESHRLWARMLHCAERAGPVLIVGAPGTGKQLVGSTLHRVGPCSGGPLVRVECRSASGLGSLAVAVEEACGGTLLLVHADAALADEQGLAKIWATDDPAAPRVVATATTAPPGTSAGPFWSMFSHRLHLAPLASRPDDVDALAEHFLLERCRALGARKRWTSAALERLRRHDWPGNVRELEAVVRRAAAHSGSELGAASLPFPGEPLDAGCFEVRVGASIESVERRLILATLASCRGNKPEAARVLGISLKTLYNRLSLYRRCAPLDSEELG
jgi:DNA-binding NtrC family response regulator